MKKIFKLVLVIVVAMFFITGCGKDKTKTNNENEKNIQIIVYDKSNNSVYDEKVKTEKELLIETLKEIDELELKTEDSQYGEYITSVKGLEQGDNYYWNYYINGEYAQVGVSSQKIKDNDVYTFKLEKFE